MRQRWSLAVRVAALTLAGALSAPAALRAQANMTATYTASSPASPTVANVQAGFFVIGSFDLVITVCGKTFCTVNMASGATVNTNVRYTLDTPPVSQAACQAATQLTSSGVDVILNATSFPTAAKKVYFCYAVLAWTTAATTAISPSELVKFTLQQKN